MKNDKSNDKFTIARYENEEMKYFHPHSERIAFLWSDEYNTLKHKAFIHGSVVDCFMLMKIKLKEWKSVYFFPTSLTLNILGDNANFPKPEEFKGYRINFEFKNGKIFLPYCYNRHWCVIVLDVNSQTMMHYDPLDRTYPHPRVRVFLDYLKFCKTSNFGKSNLFQINWKLVNYPDYECFKQKDFYNCGSYVMGFMDANGKRELYNRNLAFNPDDLRNQLAVDLLKASDILQSTCIGCENTKNLQFHSTCQICKRPAHYACAKKFFADHATCRFCKRPERNDETHSTTSYYGLPNPIKSNMCWLNSIVQSLLSFPLFDNIDHLEFPSTTTLLQYFIDIQRNLRLGESQKTKVHNLVL